VTPKEGYVRTPADTTGMEQRDFNVLIKETVEVTVDCKCAAKKKRCKKCNYSKTSSDAI
jgi:hypothetical protein